MKNYKKGFISYVIVIILMVGIAGAIVFNFYMGSLKPIKNLEKLFLIMSLRLFLLMML